MGYTSSQAKAFINQIAPLIVSEARKRGYIVASTVIAQAVLEGAAGTSALAKAPYNNHFGLKCGSSWKGRSVNMKTKEEYSVGTLTTIKDNFRCYDSMADCVSGYYDFINTKRYANLKTATSYKQYAEFLKADGYATSSSYVSSLCSVVSKYNLSQYDIDMVLPQASYYMVGSTYTLDTDLYVRSAANGTKLKYDNITIDAKAHAKYDEFGCVILKKGTRVTCKEVKELETSTWIRIPSGWICAISKGNRYVTSSALV